MQQNGHTLLSSRHRRFIDKKLNVSLGILYIMHVGIPRYFLADYKPITIFLIQFTDHTPNIKREWNARENNV
jgi:hypothetical protein